VDGELRSVPAGAFNHPSSIDARPDKFDHLLFDRRSQNEHVAGERARHGARAQIGLADLDIDHRLQLVDQHRLGEERLDLRADQAPLGIGRAGKVRPGGPPSSIREMRAQAAPEVDRFADIQRAPLFIPKDIDTRDGGRLSADPISGPLPGLPAIADDERLADQTARQGLRRSSNAEHFRREPLVVDLLRAGAHFPQAGDQFVPQHGSSLTIFVMTVAEHKAEAPPAVHCFIVTVSDTRTLEDDSSGRTIADLLTAAGHVVTGRTVVRDDPELVHSTIERHLADRGVQAIITTGGTGITSRDSTYEAISTLLEKRLDGFGELFRMLSYQEIGPAAMMSRACAGLVARRIIVALPGTPGAVRLAMEKLVIPELGHLVQQASK